MEKSTFSKNELVRICRSFSLLGGLNIFFQIIFIPAVVIPILYDEYDISLSLISLGILPLCISIYQSIFYRIKIKPFFKKLEEEEIDYIGKLKKRLFENIFCGIPILGLLAAFSNAQLHCLLDEFRYEKNDLMNTGKKTCIRCLNSFLITHLVGIIAGNGCLITLAAGEIQNNYTFPLVGPLISLFIYGLISILINGSFSRHNILLSYKVKGDEKINRLITSWRKSLKINYIVYIPVVSVFALIPFFMSKVIFKDMEMKRENHKEQYIKKCKVFMHILIWGSFISLPYLMCISLLKQWKSHPYLFPIPLAFNLIATSALNFCLSCEQEVYSNTHLMNSANGDKIKKINLLCKLCAGLIIFTFIAALPTIILLLKNLRDYDKETETIEENKMEEEIPLLE